MVATQIVTIAQRIPNEVMVGKTFREIITEIDTVKSTDEGPRKSWTMTVDVNGVDRIYTWEQMDGKIVSLDDLCDNETIGLLTSSMDNVEKLAKELGFKKHGKNKPFKTEYRSYEITNYRKKSKDGEIVLWISKMHEASEWINLEIFLMKKDKAGS